MHRALALLTFGLVALDPGAGWTQAGHRHVPPSETPDPFETQVNTYTLGNQGSPAMVNQAIGDGTPLVVWSSDGQDGSGLGVYGRAMGFGGFPEFRVNSYTAGDQDEPSVGILDFSGLSANFVVVWSSPQDGSGRGVFGQRFASDGAPVGPEFLVNTFTTGDQHQAKVARVNVAGDFVVVWNSVGQDGSGPGLFGQRYSAGGAPLGPEFRVNTYTTGAQYRAAVEAVSSDAFVVAWQDGTAPGGGSPGRGIFAQRYDGSTGAPLGPEFQANTYTTGFHGSPAVTNWAWTGNYFVVVWHSDGQDGSGLGIFAQRYEAAGTPFGSEFQVNTYTSGNQGYPSAASHGCPLIAWESDGQDGSGTGIYGQLYYLGQFPPPDPEWRFNLTTNGSQARVSLSPNMWGEFVVWQSEGQDGSGSGVYLTGETHAIPVELMQFQVE
jgi:hypothetical protein